MNTKRPRRLPARKTKIVATLGPSSNTPEVIRQLIESGMNVARLNFSHGTHESHSEVLGIVREESARLDRPVAVFQDLCGPKLRIGKIDPDNARLKEGESVNLLYSASKVGNCQDIFIDAFDPVTVIKPGEKILLADGLIQLTAKSTGTGHVECTVTDGGTLRSNVGIVIPDSELDLPCLTEKDLRDLEWAASNDIDYVALSFVGSAGDVLELKERLQSLGKNLPVIAKVERSSALRDIDRIAQTADIVMVARGDLGLELPLEKVPSAQRMIISAANFNGTPVITATQMLSSMVHEMRPTRAEVSDVSTAVRDGTDCVMLSEETTIGKHPVEAVKVLVRIIKETEREIDFDAISLKLKSPDRQTVSDAVCYAATGAADKVDASAILACTRSGYTAKLLAKYRPQQTLFGITSEAATARRMVPYWGVEPVMLGKNGDLSTEDLIVNAMQAVKEQYGLASGANVVVTAGLSANLSGSTSLMEIRSIP